MGLKPCYDKSTQPKPEGARELRNQLEQQTRKLIGRQAADTPIAAMGATGAPAATHSLNQQAAASTIAAG
jgi:hypothetical protein